MFLMWVFGTDNAQEQVGIYTNIICPRCGTLTRFEILKSYRFFHVIFIPTRKWGAKYYAKTACCGYIYELDTKIGEQIENGQSPIIKPEHLHVINQNLPYKVCPNCHVEVENDFSHCPYCGTKL